MTEDSNKYKLLYSDNLSKCEKIKIDLTLLEEKYEDILIIGIKSIQYDTYEEAFYNGKKLNKNFYIVYNNKIIYDSQIDSE